MPFPDHIRAGFSLGYLHRHALRQLLDNTPQNSNILRLDPGELQLTGIAALALDFDGVLAHHGAPVPDSAAVAWMKRCETIFGGDNIFILSNKPTNERRQWFAEHFPAMRFISGVRKKPFPDGLNKAGKLAGVTLSSLLMVDDRLLTGCLAALVAGSRPCYIRHPNVSFKSRPAAELFFWLLRTIEQVYVRLAALF